MKPMIVHAVDSDLKQLRNSLLLFNLYEWRRPRIRKEVLNNYVKNVDSNLRNGRIVVFSCRTATQRFFLVMIYVQCDLSATLTAQIDVNEKGKKNTFWWLAASYPFASLQQRKTHLLTHIFPNRSGNEILTK